MRLGPSMALALRACCAFPISLPANLSVPGHHFQLPDLTRVPGIAADRPGPSMGDPRTIMKWVSGGPAAWGYVRCTGCGRTLPSSRLRRNEIGRGGSPPGRYRARHAWPISGPGARGARRSAVRARRRCRRTRRARCRTRPLKPARCTGTGTGPRGRRVRRIPPW